MNKLDLVRDIAIGADISLQKSEIVLEAFLKIIEKTLENHEKMNIAGFGTFAVSSRSARVGRNPKTGVMIQISATNSIKFTPSKGFKEYLNN
jgi:nucleoid DNA-binding protein